MCGHVLVAVCKRLEIFVYKYIIISYNIRAILSSNSRHTKQQTHTKQWEVTKKKKNKKKVKY